MSVLQVVVWLGSLALWIVLAVRPAVFLRFRSRVGWMLFCFLVGLAGGCITTKLFGPNGLLWR
jgi:hypothetical protein